MRVCSFFPRGIPVGAALHLGVRGLKRSFAAAAPSDRSRRGLTSQDTWKCARCHLWTPSTVIQMGRTQPDFKLHSYTRAILAYSSKSIELSIIIAQHWRQIDFRCSPFCRCCNAAIRYHVGVKNPFDDHQVAAIVARSVALSSAEAPRRILRPMRTPRGKLIYAAIAYVAARARTTVADQAVGGSATFFIGGDSYGRR
jgi:hypothetical protein